jgi:two-component sensor histidine kinase
VPVRADRDRRTTPVEVIAGGLLLVRDVTELRKRDRLLLSKDATIREIHHRVKNNLQTISSLLRLQARRLTNPEAKAAVQESVRRIRTIALVHESLSREPGEDIAFIEIVRPLLRLAEEGLQSPDRPVRFTVSGDGGRIPANTATPLSVVLTELLQNAVDHGFPEGSGGGDVNVGLSQRDRRLTSGSSTTGAGSTRRSTRSGEGPRPVDRAHAGHHRTQRHDRDPTGDERRTGWGRPRRRRRRQHGTVIELSCRPTTEPRLTTVRQ